MAQAVSKNEQKPVTLRSGGLFYAQNLAASEAIAKEKSAQTLGTATTCAPIK